MVAPRPGPNFADFPVTIGLIRWEFFYWILPIDVTWERMQNSEPYDKPSWDIFDISPFSGQNMVNLDWNLPICVTWEPMQKSYNDSFSDILEISPFSGQKRVNWRG